MSPPMHSAPAPPGYDEDAELRKALAGTTRRPTYPDACPAARWSPSLSPTAVLNRTPLCAESEAMAKEETVKASKRQDIAALEVSSPAPPTSEARPDLWRASAGSARCCSG
jgi:hypothetical protein